MIGETIGNFRLVSRLGRGGMGEVYQAEQTSLQTPAAVKLLNQDISEDRDHVQRFFNEARVVSKIRHAGTVKIFDSGFHKGRAYLVMELLDGESLATRIENRGALPIAEAADIAAQIASILDATHRQGVIHRDLKPDNIFIVKDDERASGERVKILDFGIAKLTGGTLASNSPKTSGTMGTPTYMAPEQWGDSSAVDWRADAYSLGCVAFELVTGRPPFICNSIPEAYAKHLTEVPSHVSTLRSDAPHDLDVTLMRLLAKTPGERGTSMGEVSAAFAAIAGRRPSAPVQTYTPLPQPVVTPVTTLSGSTAELHMKPQPPPRANRGALYGGIAAAAVVIGLLVVVMTRSGPASDSRQPTSGSEAAPATAATPTPPTAPPAAAPAPPPPTPAPPPPPPVVETPAPPPVVETPPPPPKPEVGSRKPGAELAKHHAMPPPKLPPKAGSAAPPPKAGSAAPPPNPIDMGGRL